MCRPKNLVVGVISNGLCWLPPKSVRKVDLYSEAPGEEGEEVRSPKRKIIRVESEETQGYVREANDMDQEEGEE